MIDLASEVLYKEWESLILHMNSCGDIGELDFNELMKSDWLKGNEEVFLAKTISMFERLPECGYASPDAFYVITILAAIASGKTWPLQRIGLFLWDWLWICSYWLYFL